jgi:hypothetical protein
MAIYKVEAPFDQANTVQLELSKNEAGSFN